MDFLALFTALVGEGWICLALFTALGGGGGFFGFICSLGGWKGGVILDILEGGCTNDNDSDC